MQLRLWLVLSVSVTVAVAVVAAIVAAIVLQTSEEGINDLEAVAYANTEAVTAAGRGAVLDVVRIAQERTSTVIVAEVANYLYAAYSPVSDLVRRFASGDLDTSTPAGVEGLREHLWFTIKSIPSLAWFYITTYPNGEWVAYERIRMGGGACQSFLSDNGYPAELCRDSQQFNFMIHDQCCYPLTSGVPEYHYMPVDTDTGQPLGSGNRDATGLRRWDLNIVDRFGEGALYADWIGADNGTLCCGFLAVHPDLTQPLPRPGTQAWRAPFLWTTQYLIGWNAALHDRLGRYIGVVSAEFSMEYLGGMLQGLRRRASEEFFILDARDGGSPEDEALLASSCYRVSDSDNPCQLSPRTNATDPSAGWGPDERINYYLGASDPDQDGYFSPTPTWRVAERQGGLLRALQLLAWRHFPANTSAPTWDLSDCSDWCGRETGERSWAAAYNANPPQQGGDEVVSARDRGWSGELDFGGAPRMVHVRSMRIGSLADTLQTAGGGILRWVVVSTVKKSEYMQTITVATEAARTEVRRQVGKTTDDLNFARDMTIVVIVCLVAATTAASWAGVWTVTSPLRVLARRMECAAVMQLDNLPESEASVFEEIRSLQESFGVMVSCLREYRQYLPESLLDDEEDGDCCGNPDVPVPKGQVAICFTDIVGSTALWEASMEDMSHALSLHNRVVRKVCARFRGYEVKTIGDSFMISFQEAADAVQFAVHLQEELVRAPWADDTELGGASRYWDLRPIPGVPGALLWSGIAVRIGVAYGEAQDELNVLTGRADYRGPTVNLAARCESAAPHGMVCISQGCHAAVKDAPLGGISFVDRQSELKGIGRVQTFLALRSGVTEARLKDITSPSSGRLITVSPFIPPGFTPPAAVHKTDSHLRRRGSAVSVRSRGSSAGSQSGGVRDKSVVGIEGNQRLALELRRRQCSCAVVRASLANCLQAGQVTRRLGLYLSALEAAVDCSSGAVAAVLSVSLVITWNGTKPCANHSLGCVQFVRNSTREGASRLPCHLGLSSGWVLHGNVAGRRRYATVVGGCIEHASDLAEEAMVCGDTGLATGTAAEACADAGIATRAQLWRAGTTEVVAYEIHRGGAEAARDDYHTLAGEQDAPTEQSLLGSLDKTFRAAAAASSPEAARQMLEEVIQQSNGDAEHLVAPLLARLEKGTLRIRISAPVHEPRD
eukprot:TRINITY_DN2421_c0_g1_i1.p1 TRINITY_DN2421_c0_g1~~TRINITY_DN2421_c0_g1_i1.p1  ORF type:complete len:1205 (+),score=299.53 TRINITY_DN2421_c0_g1_i1:84-3617(+)